MTREQYQRAADGHFATANQQIERPMPMPFPQPDGTIEPILCCPAAEFAASVAIGGKGSVGVIAVAMRGPGAPLGLFASFDAGQLRLIAANISKMADTIDGIAGPRQ